MANRLFIDRNSDIPLHRQVYEALRRAIRSGELSPGMRLMPGRELSKVLGISRNTLTEAVEQLIVEGYLEARVGSGTFVKRGQLGARRDAQHGVVVPSILPSRRAEYFAQSANEMVPIGHCDHPLCYLSLRETDFPYFEWRKAAGKALSSEREWRHDRDPAGYQPLRQSILEQLAQTRGLNASVDQVFLVSGTQAANFSIASVLVDPGDVVLIEDPGYPAHPVYEFMGAKLGMIPPLASGKGPFAFPKSHRARLVYVNPTHQAALGVSAEIPRLRELIDRAAEQGVWIVEDDFGSEFRYGGPPTPSLQALDRHHRVIYVGALSNVLGPLMMVGYVVVPQSLVAAFRAMRAITSKTSLDMGHITLHEFMRSGQFGRHLRQRTEKYSANRSALLAALEELPAGATVMHSGYGLHVTLMLDPQFGCDREIALEAYGREGLCVRWVSGLSRGKTSCNGLLLGFTAGDPPETFEAGQKLVRLLRDYRKSNVAV